MGKRLKALIVFALVFASYGSAKASGDPDQPNRSYSKDEIRKKSDTNPIILYGNNAANEALEISEFYRNDKKLKIYAIEGDPSLVSANEIRVVIKRQISRPYTVDEADLLRTELQQLCEHFYELDWLETFQSSESLKDNPEDMGYLGYAYYKGERIPQDLELANFWYEKAAESGHSLSMWAIGYNYSVGLGAEKDPKKSFYWLSKAAEKGEAEAMPMVGNAMRMIGDAYRDGNGVESNPEIALNWYLKAAEKGNARAMMYMGFHYADDENEDRDLKKALLWFKNAADAGDTTAPEFVANTTKLIEVEKGLRALDKVESLHQRRLKITSD